MFIPRYAVILVLQTYYPGMLYQTRLSQYTRKVVADANPAPKY